MEDDGKMQETLYPMTEAFEGESSSMTSGEEMAKLYGLPSAR
jgi:hypothetical protein